MVRISLLVCLTGILLVSCGKKDDPYEREQKEIDAYFSSTVLDVYKAFKVSVRGTKAVGKDTVFDHARAELFRVTGYLLEQANGDSTTIASVPDIAAALADAKSSIDLLSAKDEDSLPTVLQNISFVMQTDSGSDVLGNLLSGSEEHLALSGLWLFGAHAHPDLALYEMNKVKTEDIRMVQFRCLAEICRSLMYNSYNWPYHAEKSADDLLALTASQKDALLENPWPATDANGNAVSPEQALHQLKALAYLLRSSAREKCDDDDKRKQAIDDLGEFVKEAQAGGLDHEVVDLAGLTVALKKENNDDAMKYIGQVEKRDNLTQDEKDLIAEIKTYVTDKKTEEAQKALNENGVMAGLPGNLFAEQFANLPAVRQLNSSEGGKKFIAITEIKAESLIFGTDEIDSLTKDAEGLLDKVVH